MEQVDKISVIIPVYNVRNFVDDCIESVCKQTYDNLEIILVDDGSTDGSERKCDEWAEKDSRIIVIHKGNGGVSSARNVGLEIAKGAYIGFVDSDDVIAPDMYIKMMARIMEDKSDIVLCHFKLIDETGKTKPYKSDSISDSTITMEQYVPMIYENLRNRATLITVWNRLYRREAIEGIRFDEELLHEDETFFNKILSRVSQVSIMREELYYYRHVSGSIMHSGFDVRKLNKCYALMDRLEICKKQGFADKCIRISANECLQTGIKYWLLLTTLKDIDRKTRDDLRKSIIGVEKSYTEYITFILRIELFGIKYAPEIMALAYKVVKKVKR